MGGTPNVVGAEPAAPNDRSPLTDADPAEEPSDRVVLGVAGHLADLLGLDALWVRVAFVVLALTGGIGIVIYLASWLILFGPDRTGMDWMRYLGGAIAVIGVPIMIADGSLEFFDGPVAVVALLIGLTLALWQPRGVAPPRPPAGRPLPRPLPRPLHRETAESIVAPTVAVDDREPVGNVSPAASDPGIDGNRRTTRPARPRREPSTLGRATLGLAVIVAAAGSLIDQFNGGRLHPEQWLGAAAVVCGIGLLVGVVRGRAWWLIVPALLFAGTGYFAGLMARLGIDAVDALGDQSLYVSATTPGGEATLQTGLGTIWITVDGAPADPLTIDARLALGTVEVRAVDDVAIEIHSETDRGDLTVDGVVVSGGVTRIGPDRAPDVIVDARQGIGDVAVRTYFPGAEDRVVPPRRPVPAVPDVAPVPPVIPSAPSLTSPSVIDPTVPPNPSAPTVPPTPATTVGG
jgi:phage shock protein PspC (stress-responsive transcriptional regulator)